MTIDDDEPLHDFADRSMRDSLESPANLRGFLFDAIPKLAPNLLFPQMRYLPRKFLLEDWRGRKSDILVEIPFRWEEVEQTILICLLLEHQTRPDPRMPLRTLLYGVLYWDAAGRRRPVRRGKLRTLLYGVLYWDRQWKAWENSPAPRPPFRLNPIVPIVLHTGSRPWNSARRLIDLVAGPDLLLSLQPIWAPIFWELSAQDPQRLLNSEEAFLQVLAVIRLEEADRAVFEPVFREAIGKLEALHGKDNIRWHDLLWMVMNWATWRRPPEEQKGWWDMAETMQTEAARQRQLQDWRKIVTKEFIDEGRVEGRAEGLVEGRAEGLVEGRKAVRELIYNLGKVRFGAPPAEVVQTVSAIDDLVLLSRLSNRLLDVGSWTELMALAAK